MPADEPEVTRIYRHGTTVEQASVLEDVLRMAQPTKFNENQQESMLALKEKVATLLYVGDRLSRPLLHKARHITICSSTSNLQWVSWLRLKKFVVWKKSSEPKNSTI